MHQIKTRFNASYEIHQLTFLVELLQSKSDFLSKASKSQKLLISSSKLIRTETFFLIYCLVNQFSHFG